MLCYVQGGHMTEAEACQRTEEYVCQRREDYRAIVAELRRRKHEWIAGQPDSLLRSYLGFEQYVIDLPTGAEIPAYSRLAFFGSPSSALYCLFNFKFSRLQSLHRPQHRFECSTPPNRCATLP